MWVLHVILARFHRLWRGSMQILALWWVSAHSAANFGEYFAKIHTLKYGEFPGIYRLQGTILRCPRVICVPGLARQLETILPLQPQAGVHTPLSSHPSGNVTPRHIMMSRHARSMIISLHSLSVSPRAMLGAWERKVLS
jgi:hypothetical protein